MMKRVQVFHLIKIGYLYITAPVSSFSTLRGLREFDAIVQELLTFVFTSFDEYPLHSSVKLIWIEQCKFYCSTHEKLTCPILQSHKHLYVVIVY